MLARKRRGDLSSGSSDRSRRGAKVLWKSHGSGALTIREGRPEADSRGGARRQGGATLNGIGGAHQRAGGKDQGRGEPRVKSGAGMLRLMAQVLDIIGGEVDSSEVDFREFQKAADRSSGTVAVSESRRRRIRRRKLRLGRELNDQRRSLWQYSNENDIELTTRDWHGYGQHDGNGWSGDYWHNIHASKYANIPWQSSFDNRWRGCGWHRDSGFDDWHACGSWSSLSSWTSGQNVGSSPNDLGWHSEDYWHGGLPREAGSSSYQGIVGVRLPITRDRPQRCSADNRRNDDSGNEDYSDGDVVRGGNGGRVGSDNLHRRHQWELGNTAELGYSYSSNSTGSIDGRRNGWHHGDIRSDSEHNGDEAWRVQSQQVQMTRSKFLSHNASQSWSTDARADRKVWRVKAPQGEALRLEVSNGHQGWQAAGGEDGCGGRDGAEDWWQSPRHDGKAWKVKQQYIIDCGGVHGGQQSDEHRGTNGRAGGQNARRVEQTAGQQHRGARDRSDDSQVWRVKSVQRPTRSGVAHTETFHNDGKIWRVKAAEVDELQVKRDVSEHVKKEQRHGEEHGGSQEGGSSSHCERVEAADDGGDAGRIAESHAETDAFQSPAFDPWSSEKTELRDDQVGDGDAAAGTESQNHGCKTDDEFRARRKAEKKHRREVANLHKQSEKKQPAQMQTLPEQPSQETKEVETSDDEVPQQDGEYQALGVDGGDERLANCKHGLTRDMVPAEVTCDVCKETMTKGEVAYSCRRCDADKCPKCHTEAEFQRKSKLVRTKIAEEVAETKSKSDSDVTDKFVHRLGAAQVSEEGLKRIAAARLGKDKACNGASDGVGDGLEATSKPADADTGENSHGSRGVGASGTHGENGGDDDACRVDAFQNAEFDPWKSEKVDKQCCDGDAVAGEACDVGTAGIKAKRKATKKARQMARKSPASPMPTLTETTDVDAEEQTSEETEHGGLAQPLDAAQVSDNAVTIEVQRKGKHGQPVASTEKNSLPVISTCGVCGGNKSGIRSLTDPSCKCQSSELRFEVGRQVLCRCEDGRWWPGEVAKQWHAEAGGIWPYQVEVYNWGNVAVPMDNDSYLRAAPGSVRNTGVALRFEVGEQVIGITTDEGQCVPYEVVFDAEESSDDDGGLEEARTSPRSFARVEYVRKTELVKTKLAEEENAQRRQKDAKLIVNNEEKVVVKLSAVELPAEGLKRIAATKAGKGKAGRVDEQQVSEEVGGKIGRFDVGHRVRCKTVLHGFVGFRRGTVSEQMTGRDAPYVVKLDEDDTQPAENLTVWIDNDEHIRCQAACIAAEEADLRTAMNSKSISELTTAIGKAFDIDENLDKAARELQMKLLMETFEDQMRRDGSGVGHKNPQE